MVIGGQDWTTYDSLYLSAAGRSLGSWEAQWALEATQGTWVKDWAQTQALQELLQATIQTRIRKQNE